MCQEREQLVNVFTTDPDKPWAEEIYCLVLFCFRREEKAVSDVGLDKHINFCQIICLYFVVSCKCVWVLCWLYLEICYCAFSA